MSDSKDAETHSIDFMLIKCNCHPGWHKNQNLNITAFLKSNLLNKA